jgi:hypothetical protein
MADLKSIKELGLKNYKTDTKTNTYVNFRVLNKDNKVIKDQYGNPMDYVNSACFSQITYKEIPKDACRILIWKEVDKIPYEYSFMVRWIKELNKLGFPCSICPALEENKVLFLVELSDFQHKTHVNCTLQLIRYLWESAICAIPAIYYDILEKNTTIDPFIALQDAAKILTSYSEYCYANSNHMHTYAGNMGTNVSKEQFFKNVEKRQCNVFENKDFSIHPLFVNLVPKENSNKPKTFS